jgi:hypothetical protein
MAELPVYQQDQKGVDSEGSDSEANKGAQEKRYHAYTTITTVTTTEELAVAEQEEQDRIQETVQRQLAMDRVVPKKPASEFLKPKAKKKKFRYEREFQKKAGSTSGRKDTKKGRK